MRWLQSLFVNRPYILVASVLSALAVATTAGATGMFILLNWDRVNARLGTILGSDVASVRPDEIQSTWSVENTALLSFEQTKIALGDVNQGVMGGGVESYGDGLVYVSSIGVIGYLDLDSGKLTYPTERVPMDYERVRNNILFDKSQFQLRYYRVHDIMIQADPAGKDWLYVSHNLMPPGDEEICQSIHRIGIAHSPNGIEFAPQGWQHVYTVRPCFNMPDMNWRFIGDVSGGRMVSESPSTFLYSVGTYMQSYQPGGVDLIRSDQTDLGKILEVHSESGAATIYAKGFRNPQGLVRTKSGDLWESEHGPLGGDEINLIQRGEDYGWPLVTYGLDYGPSDWPFSEDQGRHEGFVKPVHAFPVSIAPSQLVEVAADSGFERWRGDLLLATLKSKSLFRLRMEGDRLVTLEQFEFGERLRDLTWLNNGWLAMLTGESNIILLKPSSSDSETAEPMRIAGYASINELEARFASELKHGGWGRQLFATKCATCHGLGPELAPGPQLGGIVGADIARIEDYNYSSALQNAQGRWTRSRLKDFLDDPQSSFPGSVMPSVELEKYAFRALMDYLETTEFEPEPVDQ